MWIGPASKPSRQERTAPQVSKKRNKNARRGRPMSEAQRARERELREQTGQGATGAAQDTGVQAARQRASRSSGTASSSTAGSGHTMEAASSNGDEVRPGLFPPSRRPPRDPNRKPWETYACMIMAVLIVFLVPDWRDPENPWPMWFYVAPLAFGGLGALFALLDKRRRLAWMSLGLGLVLFLGLISVIALTR